MAIENGDDPDEVTPETIDNDPFFWEAQHDERMAELTDLMKGQEYWKIVGSDMGWLKRSGYKYALATTGSELLEAILPNCETTWTIYKDGKGFSMRVSHHDAPMGEYYKITPCAQSTYLKNCEPNYN